MKVSVLVEVLIALAVAVLALILIVPMALRPRLDANEKAVRGILMNISAAAEVYKKSSIGTYPAGIADIVAIRPGSFDAGYLNASHHGYRIACVFASAGYSCSATPTQCAGTGRVMYAVTTGGVLNATACSPHAS